MKQIENKNLFNAFIPKCRLRPRRPKYEKSGKNGNRSPANLDLKSFEAIRCFRKYSQDETKVRLRVDASELSDYRTLPSVQRSADLIYTISSYSKVPFLKQNFKKPVFLPVLQTRAKKMLTRKKNQRFDPPDPDYEEYQLEAWS